MSPSGHRGLTVMLTVGLDTVAGDDFVLEKLKILDCGVLACCEWKVGIGLSLRTLPS